MKMRNLLVTGFATAAAVAASGAFGQSIHVVVNGQPLSFPYAQPQMQNDRVLVPLRGIFERLGAHVDWNPANQTVSAYRDQTKIQLTIGQTTVSVDGQPVQLDVPAEVVDGSTMVPLRFVSEALHNHVSWDANTQTVIISGEGGDYIPNPQMPPPPPPPPPIYMGAPIEFPHPVYWRRDASIPVVFGVGFNFDHCHVGMSIDAIVPSYQGLPPNCHAHGTVTNVTVINNVQHVTINYTNIVTPGGQTIPIQARAVAQAPRGDGATAAPPRVTMVLTKPVQIPAQHKPPKGMPVRTTVTGAPPLPTHTPGPVVHKISPPVTRGTTTHVNAPGHTVTTTHSGSTTHMGTTTHAGGTTTHTGTNTHAGRTTTHTGTTTHAGGTTTHTGTTTTHATGSKGTQTTHTTTTSKTSTDKKGEHGKEHHKRPEDKSTGG